MSRSRTVAKYMSKRGGPSGQTWGTFLRNHAPYIAAMDLFVVPTISFVQLYVLVIVRLARRELVWINVTSHPTAEWIARQITEAFPWNEAPRYLIRDQDAIYGTGAASGGQRRQPAVVSVTHSLQCVTLASNVMSALRSLETGQPALALAASS